MFFIKFDESIDLKMKTFLKLEKPCQESWENMHPISGGRFCDSCSKKVVDLTQLSDLEILKILENNNGSLCGKLRSNQNKRLLFPEINIKVNNGQSQQLNYKKITVGMFLGLSLVACNSPTSNNFSGKIEQILNATQYSKDKKETDKKTRDGFTEISGFVADKSQKPIENAEIIFVTLKRQYKTFSKKDGKFYIEVPSNIVKDKNIFHIGFNSVNYNQNDSFRHYEEKNIFVNKNVLQNLKFNDFEKIELLMGEITFPPKIPEPEYFIDGKKISEKEFLTKNKIGNQYLFFEKEFAKALYPETKDQMVYLFFIK